MLNYEREKSLHRKLNELIENEENLMRFNKENNRMILEKDNTIEENLKIIYKLEKFSEKNLEILKGKEEQIKNLEKDVFEFKEKNKEINMKLKEKEEKINENEKYIIELKNELKENNHQDKIEKMKQIQNIQKKHLKLANEKLLIKEEENL